MATDETAITEISISQDGRVFVFGLSAEVLDVLLELCPHEAALLARRECLSSAQKVTSQDDHSQAESLQKK